MHQGRWLWHRTRVNEGFSGGCRAVYPLGQPQCCVTDVFPALLTSLGFCNQRGPCWHIPPTLLKPHFPWRSFWGKGKVHMKYSEGSGSSCTGKFVMIHTILQTLQTDPLCPNMASGELNEFASSCTRLGPGAETEWKPGPTRKAVLVVSLSRGQWLRRPNWYYQQWQKLTQYLCSVVHHLKTWSTYFHWTFTVL